MELVNRLSPNRWGAVVDAYLVVLLLRLNLRQPVPPRPNHPPIASVKVMRKLKGSMATATAGGGLYLYYRASTPLQWGREVVEVMSEFEGAVADANGGADELVGSAHDPRPFRRLSPHHFESALSRHRCQSDDLHHRGYLLRRGSRLSPLCGRLSRRRCRPFRVAAAVIEETPPVERAGLRASLVSSRQTVVWPALALPSVVFSDSWVGMVKALRWIVGGRWFWYGLPGWF
ncbi:U2 snRNP auxilliary factor [Striga asiatica]|uniref:U2 snRNP auxilliary factor n=1 Tax=Striga asiatica TaxID=4170 RepID=A0A5A7QQE5_STRAF|nr:U2 snRNP auxilliary factor [Striga asiatica]